MKSKAVTILLAAAMMSGCITGRDAKTDSPTGNYKVLPEQATVSRTNKIWILFFPFGGKSEEKREAQCYERMIKSSHADGIIAQKYVHKKVTIPLILFTYSYKYTTLTGKPFIVSVDSTHAAK